MKVKWISFFAGIALLPIMASAVGAFPSSGPDCTSCHAREAGALNVVPDLLKLMPGETGQFAFDVSALGSNDPAALKISGLDAPGLNATPETPGSGGWTQQGTNWLTSDFFTAPGSILLNLTIGANATLGTYPLEVNLAGGRGTLPEPPSRWSTVRDFTIQVIPEPATISLLAMALVSGACLTGKRRYRRKAAGDHTACID